MKILTKDEVTLMEDLCGVSQETLKNVLYKFLKQRYEEVTYHEDFLLAEGNIPIALVAHMDTVFKSPPKEVFYDRKKNVMWSPTGMGADDRAGVFSIIQIIKDGYRPHIIFTTDEEMGCIGAEELSYFPCPFKDLRYIIQLDRRNSNDCVFYDCDNPEFEKYVESFGFITAWGSFTDICELCPQWGIAGVNLSIGYRDEHTTSEVLFVGQMLSTIEKVKKMLSVENIPNFKYIPAAGSYYNWGPASYYLYGYEDDDYPIDPFPPKGTIKYKCHCCGNDYDIDEVLDVKLIRGGKGYYCADCLNSNNVEWCKKCGECFEIDPKRPYSQFCKDCAKKIKKGKK